MSFTANIDEVVAANRNGLLASADCWKRTRLKDFATILNGYPFESARFSKDKGTPLIRIRDILPGKTETFYEGDFDPLFIVQPGEILVGMDGDFNCAPWSGVAALLNQRVCKITPDESRCSKDFLRYILPGYLNAINAETSSVTVKHLSSRTIADIPLPLPSIGDQQRIVAEIEKQFTRLEAGLAGLHRLQANLKRYRAAVLRFAFGGKLLAKDNDWPTTTLGEVCTVLSGYGFPERLQGRSSGDVGFYKVGDISAAWQRGERVLTQANHYISHAETQELRAKPLPAGTVVFAKIGAAIALNRRAILGQPSLVDNNVMGLLAGNKVDPAFLFYFTCTLRLNDLARATTVPSIRKGDIESITLDLPPLTEQHRIVTEVERRLSVIDELETVVAANIKRATRLRHSILQRAFAGELVS